MIRRSKRRLVGGLVVGLLGIFILAGIVGSKHAGKAAASVDTAHSQADAKAFINQMTDDMDVCDTRSPLMENPMRSGDAVRADDDAQNANGICRRVASMISGREIPSSLPDAESAAFKKMKDDCAEAYGERAVAFSDLEDALDSNGRVSKVAAYRENAERTAGRIAACKEQIRQASVPLGI